MAMDSCQMHTQVHLELREERGKKDRIPASGFKKHFCAAWLIH